MKENEIQKLMETARMARDMNAGYKASKVTHKRMRQCEALLKLMTGVAVASIIGAIMVAVQL